MNKIGKADTNQKNTSQLLHSIQYKLFKQIKGFKQRVVALIMEDFQTSQFTAIIFSIVLFFQLTYLNFGLKLMYIWHDDQVEIINLLLKYFTITIDVKNVGIQIYLLVLYLCLGLIIASILLMILLSTLSNQRAMFLPLKILQFLLKIILSFGYWPIIRMQFGYLACQYTKTGKFVMMFEVKEECWTQNYYIHAIIAIIGLIISFLFVLLICYICYESRNTDSDALCKRNSKSKFTLHVYLFLQIMIYQLLPTPDYTIVIISILLILSFIFFINTHFEQTYYKQYMQKLWSIMAGLNLWTVIMMLYTYILDVKQLQKAFTIFLIGIPMITIIILIQNDRFQIDFLQYHFQSEQNWKQIVQSCDILLKNLQNEKQQSILILESFIQIHSTFCQRNDCYGKIDNIQQFSESQQRREHIIYHLINQIYQDGVKKYPENVELRLHYIYFLIDYKKQYAFAQSELTIAQINANDLVNQFQIFRFKIIVSNLQRSFNLVQKINQKDFNYQSLTDKFFNQLEKCSLHYLEFWSQLLEEYPDINKIKLIGFVILKQKQELNQMYEQILDFNPNAIKIVEHYQYFHKYILNEQFQFTKKLNQQSCKECIEDIEDITNKTDSIIIVKAHLTQTPTIINLNLACCSLLGYTKTDLIQRPLNVIIPEIYHEKHDCALDNYLKYKVGNKENSIIKQLLVFAQCKSKYIIPINTYIYQFESHHNEIIMQATLNIEFPQKNECYLICYNNGQIVNISSSCISLLGIDFAGIQLSQANITDFFPNFFNKIQDFFGKHGSQLQLDQDKDSTSISRMSKKLRYSIHSTGFNTIFQCYVKNITFSFENHNDPLGLIIKLELISRKQTMRQMNYLTQFSLASPQQKQLKCFKFAPKKLLYQQCNINQDEIESNNETIIWEKSFSFHTAVELIKLSQHKPKTIIIINYADGIRTQRLINGYILDIVNEDTSYISEKNDEENIQEIENQQINLELNLPTILENKKNLQIIIQQTQQSILFRLTTLFTNTSFFSLIILNIILFLFSSSDIKSIIDHSQFILLTNYRQSKVFLIQSLLQDISFINLNYYPYLQTSTQQQLLIDSKQDLIEENNNLQEIQNILDNVQISILSKYQNYQQQYFSQNVPMQSLNGQISSYSYKEAIDQLISKSVILQSSTLESFNFQNQDYFYYIFNSFNGVVWNGRLGEFYFGYIVISLIDNSIITKQIFLILNTVVLIILLMLCLFLIYLQEKEIINSLILFNTFDSDYIQYLIVKCETFIGMLESGDFEENKTYYTQEFNSKQQNISKLSNKKKNKLKNTSNQSCKLIIQILFFYFIIQGCFIYLYIDDINIYNKLYSLLPLLNQTSIIEGYFRFGDNSIRQIFAYPDMTLVGQENGIQTILYHIDNLYTIDADLHIMNYDYKDLLDDNYYKAVVQLYLNNPCAFISQEDESITQDECETFQNGILKGGLSVGLIKYIESLRYIIYLYQQSSIQNTTYNISNNNTINIGLNLLNTQLGFEIRQISKKYITASFKYLSEALSQSLIQEFNTQQLKQVLFLVSFLFIMIIIIFFNWLPQWKFMNEQQQKTKELLLLIPLEALKKSITLKLYIKSLTQRQKKFI